MHGRPGRLLLVRARTESTRSRRPPMEQADLRRQASVARAFLQGPQAEVHVRCRDDTRSPPASANRRGIPTLRVRYALRRTARLEQTLACLLDDERPPGS